MKKVHLYPEDRCWVNGNVQVLLFSFALYCHEPGNRPQIISTVKHDFIFKSNLNLYNILLILRVMNGTFAISKAL